MANNPKPYFSTGYVEVNSNAFSNAGCYVLQDGRQFFDFACIFAANLNWDSVNQRSELRFNPQVSHLLNETDQVKQLQAKGISVLLSVLNNHDRAGWSCFTSASDAEQFAQQLASCVEFYGFAGIDIDDEWSDGTPNLTSLAMVTSFMRDAMPDKVISKALWQDSRYFQEAWNGRRLADNLSYGWEMSYGGDPQSRLKPYLEAGMSPKQLALGVQLPYAGDVQAIAEYTVRNGLGGFMAYDVDTRSAQALSTASQTLYGEPAQAQPNCLAATAQPAVAASVPAAAGGATAIPGPGPRPRPRPRAAPRPRRTARPRPSA